jgi:hypothetical protein
VLGSRVKNTEKRQKELERLLSSQEKANIIKEVIRAMRKQKSKYVLNEVFRHRVERTQTA